MVLKVLIYKNPETGMHTNVYIIDYNIDQKIKSVAQPVDLVWKDMPVGGIDKIEPTLVLPDYKGDFLGALSQALIENGYRDKAVSKDGEIIRMESHIIDLRKIAFKQLKIE